MKYLNYEVVGVEGEEVVMLFSSLWVARDYDMFLRMSTRGRDRILNRRILYMLLYWPDIHHGSFSATSPNYKDTYVGAIVTSTMPGYEFSEYNDAFNLGWRDFIRLGVQKDFKGNSVSFSIPLARLKELELLDRRWFQVQALSYSKAGGVKMSSVLEMRNSHSFGCH